MKYVIKEMKELDFANNKTYGNKAAYLSDAQKKGLNVPDGFCIVFRGIHQEINNSDFIIELKRHFQSLKMRTGASRYIVRSSAQYEDRKSHIFPGIFESKKDVCDLKDLLNAVDFCYKSFRTKIMEMYISSLEVKVNENGNYCIMVQEQIEPEYSGVAFTKIPISGYYEMNNFWIEMTQKHCQDMLLGKIESNTYIVDKQKNDEKYRKMSTAFFISQDLERKIVNRLKSVINEIIHYYGCALDIEWGYYKEEIYIFQIRPIQCPKKKKNSESNDIGWKAEAMKKFRKLNLFQNNLLVIEPGKDLEEIEKELKETKFMKSEITIRYSCKRELGLPRYFAINKEDAYEFIKRTYHSEWAIIIHESITVRDSFELYLDGKKCILEHVPGMWESDNKGETDIWIYHNNRITSYTANGIRRARYEDAENQEYKMVMPYKEEEIVEIAKEVSYYIQIISQYWSIKEGVNFHFVKDDDGRVFFLNHRKISKIQDWELKYENLTVIEKVADFDKWKGGSILLKINIKRGEEILLKEYVPFLKKVDAKIYVQFGILSHPAILLREMGIEVYPEHMFHKRKVFEI